MTLSTIGAPFPFILGIHPSYIEQDDRCISEETVRVYLDTNVIDYGSYGPPPPLPDRQSKKLLQEIIGMYVFMYVFMLLLFCWLSSTISLILN